MEESPATSQPIVGTWLASVETEGDQAQYLFSFSADFCVDVSAPPVIPQDARDPHVSRGLVFASSGYGTWQSPDGLNVVLTVVRLVTDETGSLFGSRFSRAEIQVDAAHDTWSGQFQTDVLTATGSEPEIVGSVDMRGKRVSAEAPYPGEGTIRGVKP